MIPAMKVEREHRFLRHLLFCLGTALVACAMVEFVCIWFGVAPLFTPNVPLNEKMRFLREHPLDAAPVGVVSGASIALNDVDSDLLEDRENRPFINLGANGISVPTAQRFYEQLASIHPVREVVFAVTPLEIRDAYGAEIDVPTPVFQRYVLGNMTVAEEFAYRDIPGLMSYWTNWRDYHSRAAAASLVFSKTGAVPLEITRENADPRLWSGETIEPAMACEHCTDDLTRFCNLVRAEGRPFTIVLGPIRPDVIERMPKVRALAADRRARTRAVAQSCGAALFDVTEYSTLDDSCFANSGHLNANGMSVMTEEFVRFRRGESIPKGTALTCNTPRVIRAAGSHERETTELRIDRGAAAKRGD